MDRRQLLILSVAFEGGLLLLALGIGALSGRPPFATAAAGPAALALGVAGTLPMLGLLWGIERSRSPLLRELKGDIDGAVAKLFARSRLPDLALISLMAGVAEEALFRGALQEILGARLGVPAGLLAASLAFGLAHYISPSYALYAALVGGYLGLLYLATGNILVPVIVHALYDFVALAWLVRSRRPPTGAAPLEEPPAR